MAKAKCIMCGETLSLSMVGWIAHRLESFGVHYPHSLRRAKEAGHVR